MRVTDIREPFLLPPPLGIKLLRPWHAAVERAEHEWHTRLPAFGSEPARRRRTQRRDAMDDIELAVPNPVSELFPDEVLEVGVGESLNGGDGRPANARAPADRFADRMHPPRDRLGVDRREILS